MVNPNSQNFFIALQTLVSQDLLIIKALLKHTILFRTPLEEGCARCRELYVIHTKDRLPGPQQDSNPQSQHAVTAHPLQSANSHLALVKLIRT